MRLFRPLLLVFLMQSSAAFPEEFKVEGFALPEINDAEHAILEKMPSLKGIPFNPVLIELYREELESFRRNEVDRLKRIMFERCDAVRVKDGIIRNTKLPKQYSWQEYENVIKPYFNVELEKCNISSNTSPYASIYRRAVDQYKSFIRAYQEMSRRCKNSPSCSVKNT